MEPLITGKRLLLRELREEDQQAVHDYASRPSTVEYLPWGPNSVEETREFLQRALRAAAQEPRHHYELAAVQIDSQQLIGAGRLTVQDPRVPKADMGYVIHPEYWGEGMGTEVALMLLQLGFRRIGLHRIYALCDPANVASARILEKLGMTLEGCLRESARIRGEIRDQHLYSLLRSDWEPERSILDTRQLNLDDTWIG